jgi:hypothetical protein
MTYIVAKIIQYLKPMDSNMSHSCHLLQIRMNSLLPGQASIPNAYVYFLNPE